MPHPSMFDKVQVVAKQQYAQELAAYTLMQWNVARGAAEAQGKPPSARGPPADELAPSQRRRVPLARAASALSSAASSSSADDPPPPATAAGSAPAVKAVDYAPLPLPATPPPAPAASQASSPPAPAAEDARH